MHVTHFELNALFYPPLTVESSTEMVNSIVSLSRKNNRKSESVEMKRKCWTSYTQKIALCHISRMVKTQKQNWRQKIAQRKNHKIIWKIKLSFTLCENNKTNKFSAYTEYKSQTSIFFSINNDFLRAEVAVAFALTEMCSSTGRSVGDFRGEKPFAHI